MNNDNNENNDTNNTLAPIINSPESNVFVMNVQKFMSIAEISFMVEAL